MNPILTEKESKQLHTHFGSLPLVLPEAEDVYFDNLKMFVSFSKIGNNVTFLGKALRPMDFCLHVDITLPEFHMVLQKRKLQ